jgi:hypothetical protein
MPVTIPAHQAAVLPLFACRRLPPLALLIGSCVPDLTYLWPPNPVSLWAHHPLGAALSSISLGLLFYLWAELLVMPTLSRSVPTFFGIEWSRFCMTRGLPANSLGWSLTLCALVLGAESHVLLDSFTHASLWPGNKLQTISFLEIPLTKFLQYGFGLLGSIAVLVFMRKRYPTLPKQERAPNQKYGAAIMGLCLGVCVGAALVFMQEPVSLFRFFWSSIAWGLLGLTLACLLLRRGVWILL